MVRQQVWSLLMVSEGLSSGKNMWESEVHNDSNITQRWSEAELLVTTDAPASSVHRDMTLHFVNQGAIETARLCHVKQKGFGKENASS